MGALMAVGTLWLESRYEQKDPANIALYASVAMVVFALFNIAIGLGNRSEFRTAFTRDILSDRRQLMLYGIALGVTYIATEFSFLQRLLGTSELPLNEWLICIALAVVLLIIDEIVKYFLRRRHPQPAEAQSAIEVVHTDQPSQA